MKLERQRLRQEIARLADWPPPGVEAREVHRLLKKRSINPTLFVASPKSNVQ